MTLPPVVRWIALSLLVSSPAAASDVERTAREFVLLSWGGDFSRAAALAVDEAPGLDALHRTIRNALRVRCVRVEGVTIESVAAAAEITIAVRKDQLPLEITRLRLRTQRGLIAAIEFPDEELADRVIAARTLTGSSPAIARVLARRAIALVDLPNRRAEAVAIAELARQAAYDAGDAGGESLAISVIALAAALDQHRERAASHTAEMMAGAESSGDADVLARAWFVAAGIHALYDQHSLAVDDAYERALRFAEQGEDSTLLVRALHIIGGRAFLKGDHYTARLLLERSLAWVRENDDGPGEVWYELQLGLIYRYQDDLDLGAHHLRRGLKLAEEKAPSMVAYALSQLAEVLLVQGRLDEVAELHARALKLLAGRPGGVTAMLMEQSAIIEAKRGRLDEGECVARESDVVWKRVGFDYGPPLDLLIPSVVERGEHRKALRFALEYAARNYELRPGATVNALTAAAAAYRELGFPARARESIAEAINLREQLHERISGGAEQQARSGDWTAACYELAAEIELDAGRTADALAYVERGRGRVLHDALRGGRVSVQMLCGKFALGLRYKIIPWAGGKAKFGNSYRVWREAVESEVANGGGRTT